MFSKRCPGAFAGLALLTFGLLAACDGSKAGSSENPRTALAGQMQEAGENVRAPFDLPAVFDCVREEGGLRGMYSGVGVSARDLMCVYSIVYSI